MGSYKCPQYWRDFLWLPRIGTDHKPHLAAATFEPRLDRKMNEVIRAGFLPFQYGSA
jgi:hypothetical protein